MEDLRQRINCRHWSNYSIGSWKYTFVITTPFSVRYDGELIWNVIKEIK